MAGLCNRHQDVSEEDTRPSASDGMSLQEKLDHWGHYKESQGNQHLDITGDEPDDYIDDEEHSEDDAEPTFAEMARYREVLLESPAFEWLTSRIVRETRIVPPETDHAGRIRSRILNKLGLPDHISRQSSLQHKRVVFVIPWQFLNHLRDQQYCSELRLAPETIPRVLTLTGYPDHAQATTCAEYMEQTWPQSGPQMLEFIIQLASPEASPNLQTTLRDETIVARAKYSSSRFTVFVVFGNPYSIAEVGQQLAWLAGTFTTSPFSEGVAFCTPSVIVLNNEGEGAPEDARFQITYDWGEPTIPTAENGLCWLSMFRNPVVVTGFPILRRPHKAEGLEVTPSIMTALIKSRRAVDFRGQTFLKGFSSMLAVISVVADVILWHHFFDPEGRYIACSDSRVCLPESRTSVGVGAIQESRHIIGWCESVRNSTGKLMVLFYRPVPMLLTAIPGAPDANYNIRWSALGRTHSKCAFQNISVSGGKYLSVSTSIALGLRSKPQHIKFDEDDYIDMLRVVRDRQFIIYDVEDRRAWLVGGASVVLHIFRAGVRHDKNDPDLQRIFIFNEEDLVEAEDPYSGSSAAFEVLSNFEHNLELPLYRKPREVKEEQTMKLGVKPEVAIKSTSSFFCLKDRISKICNILMDIMVHQDDVSAENGVAFRLRSTSRAQLEGFDFMDIAAGQGTLWPRVQMLHHMGRGWTDFTRAIHAVTLFGKGFGELLEPAPHAQSRPSCKACHWNGYVPQGHDYLAAGTHELSRIIQRQGDRSIRPWRLVDNIYWFTPEKAFEPCCCTRKQQHDRVQVLLPPKLTKRGIRTPGSMPPNGAVIFGHSKKYPLRWPATGDPGEGEPVEDIDEGLMSMFYDSGLGASLGSSSRDAEGTDSSSRDASWRRRSDIYMLDNEQFIERDEGKEVDKDNNNAEGEDEEIDEVWTVPTEDSKGKRKARLSVSSLEETRYRAGSSRRA